MELTQLFKVVLLHTLVHVAKGFTSLAAEFNMLNITGRVTFQQNTIGGTTTVTYNLSGLKTLKVWTLTERRAIYDTNLKCQSATIGPQIHSTLTGNIQTSGNGSMTILGSQLNDLSSLIGSSLVLSSSVCATLEEVEEQITAFAQFPQEIAGLVTFRQRKEMPSGLTTVISDLFQVTNTGSASIRSLKWKIHSGQVRADTIQGSIGDEQNRCGNIGNVFNPIAHSGTCDTNNQGNCPIGDLSSKLGNVAVAILKGDQIKGFKDRNLPLSGSNSIIGKSLAIYDENDRVISCANIIKYDKKRVSADISRDGVEAHISFEQLSPYDKTFVHVDIRGLKGLASGYHVHEYPVPYQMAKADSMCNSFSVGGHFNPFSITDWPSAAVSTNDLYEIGDLSSKYGLLDNKTNIDVMYTDWNLPLFGVNSIVGRSLVIHKLSGGARWVCGNIEYGVPTTMATAAVTFVYPVIGQIVFRQPRNLPYYDTQVYLELKYNSGSANATSGHKWHIHANRTGSDVFETVQNGRCNSAAGHYNPYNVDLEGTYTTSCDQDNPLRCELGDLSGKHGRLNIGNEVDGVSRAFFTDVDLPLSGLRSMMKRSLVVHGLDGTRLSCGDIYEIPFREAKVDTWQAMTSSSVYGSALFKSGTPGMLSGKTGVTLDIKHLASEASGFHVHAYPLPSMSDAPCSSSAVGGHFNPFDIDINTSPSPGNGTDDKYEIGDLSGKYGDPMDDNVAVDGHYIDTNLPLRGPNSIVGRSFVIHKKTGGARWVCGNILEDISKSNGKLFEAVVNFDRGQLRGQIHLSQYLYPDGGMSDTGILVNLTYASDDTKMTDLHRWRIHDSPATDFDSCVSPGATYNPFKAKDDTSYDTQCSFSNPLRCKVGDQSGKLDTYDIGRGRRYFTDVNLPLNGKYGVIGTKSFVINDPNRSTARLACANIMPYMGVSKEIRFPIGSKVFDRFHMAQTLASSLRTDSYNIVTEKMSESAECIKAKVVFLGNDRETLKTDLENQMGHNYASMGIYAPQKCAPPISSAASLAMSMATILIVFVLQKIVNL